MGKCLAGCNLPYCEITVCNDCFHNDVCDDRDYLTENNCFEFCSKDEIQRWKDLAEQGRLAEIPDMYNIKVGDKLFDVVKCKDEKTRIREMIVCDVSLFGNLSKGKLWNLYLEDDYTYACRTWFDINKTVFKTRAEAEARLAELEEK